MSTKSVYTALIISACSALFSVSVFVALFYFIGWKDAKLALISEEIALSGRAEEANIAMKRLLNDTEERREKLDSYFLGSDGVVDFIESVEGLSRLAKTRVSVNSVGVEEAGEQKQFEYVLLNASARGSFANLYWLLSLIESMPIKLQVTKVVLEEMPSESKNAEKEWRLEFIIRAAKLK